jgi:hypothetical protein
MFAKARAAGFGWRIIFVVIVVGILYLVIF